MFIPVNAAQWSMKPIRGLTSRIELQIFYVEASSCLGKQIYSSVFHIVSLWAHVHQVTQ